MAKNPSISNGELNISSTSQRLKSLLKIKYPIIQAPIGGIVNSKLVVSVANTGCLGGLPLSWATPASAEQIIKDIQAQTNGAFYANFVLNFEPHALAKTLDLGVEAIQFSWGMPSKKMCQLIKSENTILGIQVTSEASAKMALDLGADYLVCQGIEAGGHVHASRPLEEALSRVLKFSGHVPVVASGGIATGKAIYKYMSMGAAGVVMGSRFFATQESGAHIEYKNALVEAKSEDTVFTVCMNKGWENSAHRILRNETYENWEAVGCPSIGERPGEKDIIGQNGPDKPVERYSISSPTTAASGDIRAMANYAGMGISDINDIPSVGDLVNRLWESYLEYC